MSRVLPLGTRLGELSIRETYVYYEGPRLFLAVSATGVSYLALFVDEDDSTETYLYALVSGERLGMVRSGGMTVYGCLTDPDGPIFAVRCIYDSGSIEHEVTIAPDPLPEWWLPERDATIGIATPTKSGYDANDLGARTLREGRTLGAIRIPGAVSGRTEGPVRQVAPLISKTQQATDAIGQELADEPTRTGAIKRAILRRTDLSVVDLQAASFVVVLAPTRDENRFPFETDDLAQKSFSQLVDVLAAASDASAFRQAISGLRHRALAKLGEVLEEVIDVNGTVEFALAHDGHTTIATLDPASARSALDVIAEASEDIEVLEPIEATLIGANLRTRSFELEVIRPLDDRTRIYGKMDPDMASEVDSLEVGTRHLVTLRRETTVDAVTGEPRARYRLVEIAATTTPSLE